MPEETEQEKTEKLNEELMALMIFGDASSYSYDSGAWSYYLCGLKGEGVYSADFRWIRESLETAGLSEKLGISEEEEADFLRHFVLSEEQRKISSFTPSHFEALDSWAKTTDKNIIFIGGNLDPRSSVYIDGGDNPHFHTYILSGISHQTKIGQFDREIQNEIIEIMKSWLP